MNRWSKRILVIAAGTVLVSGTILAFSCWKSPGCAGEVQDALRDAWLQFRAERIAERARTELDPLDPHPFAGTYRSAGMWGDVVFLTEEAGFAVYDDSWCGTCAHWRAYGRIRELGPRELELDAGIAVESEVFEREGRILLVPWSEYLFAVRVGQIETFCRQAAQGGEFPDFRFRQTSGTSSVPASLPGLPEVPERFAYLLRADPLDEE